MSLFSDLLAYVFYMPLVFTTCICVCYRHVYVLHVCVYYMHMCGLHTFPLHNVHCSARLPIFSFYYCYYIVFNSTSGMLCSSDVYNYIYVSQLLIPSLKIKGTDWSTFAIDVLGCNIYPISDVPRFLIDLY